MITGSFRIVRGVRASPLKSTTSWTKDEDEKLIAAVNFHGAQKWTALSSEIEGRTGKQCRERWHNHLNPEINNNPWAELEDDTIMYYYQKIGSKWSTISKMMNGRTDNAIKNRFITISRRTKYTKGLTEWNMFESSTQAYEDSATIIDAVADDSFLRFVEKQCPEPVDKMHVASDGQGERDIVLDLDTLLWDVPLAIASMPSTPKTPVTNVATFASIGSENIDGESITSLFEKSSVRKHGLNIVIKKPTVPFTIRKALCVRMRSSVCDRPLKINSKLF